MPTPPYILDLRAKVGHAKLLLPGLVAVVFDDAGRLLMHRRSDTGEWNLISGILEFGEQPDEATAREVYEETGLRVTSTRLLHSWMTPPITYANGDQAEFFTVAYHCNVEPGEPRVNDEESVEVRFIHPDDLPPLRDDLQHLVQLAVAQRARP